MQILVRDNAPELNKFVTHADPGWVKAHVSDQRRKEFERFFVRNSDLFGSGDHATMWGRGAARDATEAMTFSINQLTYLEAKTQLRSYTPLRYQELLAGCIDYSAGPWAKDVRYKVKDQTGIGRRIAPGATDIPMVDSMYALNTIPVEMGGIGYSYTVEDIVTSSYLGQPLPEDLQGDAVQAYFRHMNVVALQGELNFKGLYNNSTATAANRTSGAVWDAATGDTIVSDIVAAYGAYVVATQGLWKPSKLIVPLSTEQVMFKRLGTGTASNDTSIRDYVEKTLKLTIESDVLLETAAAGSAKRCVFAAPVNDNLVFHIPRPVQFLAPQMANLRVTVPGSYKYAGLELRRPQAVRYMDLV